MSKVLFALSALLALGWTGCDSSAESEYQLREGQRLSVTEYVGTEQPASRQAYAELGVFGANSRGGIHLFRPGTGPDDPPRLVRSIDLEGLHTWDAQVDRDGFVWVATPDHSQAFVHRAAYVIDPHAATVHRVVKLEEDVRAAARVIVGSDRVYFYGARNGFSAGVGSVDRACVMERSLCTATLFTELGNVGLPPARAFHLTDRWLYVASNANSRDRKQAVRKIDLSTGEIAAGAPFTSLSWDGASLYAIEDTTSNRHNLVRLDLETLAVEKRLRLGGRGFVLHTDSLLYVTGSGSNGKIIEVRSAMTGEILRSLDVSEYGRIAQTFGFVAAGVIMLNGTMSLDTQAERVIMDPAGERFAIPDPSASLARLPEGNPL